MRWSTYKWHQKKLERDKHEQEWHLWFAWSPVRLESSYYSFRWLEKVARRRLSQSVYAYEDPVIAKLQAECHKVSDEIKKESSHRVVG